MTRILLICLSALGLSGCMVAARGPNKFIATSPDGRPVEFATSQAAAAAMGAPADAPAVTPRRTFPTSTVVKAVYAEPVSELPPIKPFLEWTEQEAAADALGRIGVAAVPALIDALSNPEPAVRVKAIEVLGRMGADAKDAVPHLVKLLDDPSEAVRKAATRTLGRIGPPADQAVPALMRTLLQPPS